MQVEPPDLNATFMVTSRVANQVFVAGPVYEGWRSWRAFSTDIRCPVRVGWSRLSASGVGRAQSLPAPPVATDSTVGDGLLTGLTFRP
jgi:hypothetical protein